MIRDEALDRLLKRTMRAGEDAHPGEDCLDPDVLAAWADGGLPPRDRGAAEAHVAACDRCLSVMAAMMRTAPPPVPPSPARWLSMRWLVPLATAAVAVVAWVIVDDAPRELTREPKSVSVDSAAPAKSADAAVTQEAAPQPLADSMVASNAPSQRRDSSVLRDESRKADAGAAGRAAGAEAPQLRKDAAAATGRAGGRAKEGDTAEDRGTRMEETLVAPPPPAAAPAPRAAFEPAPSVSEQERQRADGAAPPPPARPLPAEPSAEAVASLARRTASVMTATIQSPDANVAWQISGAVVQRTTDAGRTWSAQPTGPAAIWLAGAAPSREVCWIVGRRGAIALTTDGGTWRRLAFPDAADDLVRVAAADALTATVSTSAGRTYRTSDGGRTWTLQESPATPF